ncbi:hypothetical protein V5799_018192 [Amblyomma americanum]|uniref:BTB domain-containing protein n=1 Tax=Amblyomma americanum TaxID=6943 RepID=A0AAQ4F169_AMBAM
MSEIHPCVEYLFILLYCPHKNRETDVAHRSHHGEWLPRIKLWVGQRQSAVVSLSPAATVQAMVLLKMYMDGFTYSHISEAATAPISTQYTSFNLNELFITFLNILTEYKVCYRCYKRTNFWHWTSSTRVIVSIQTETVPEFSLWRYLGTRELADVEIVVHWEHAPEQHASSKAHRMILALQNDVFRAMFFGHFAREDRLTIMDLHPDGVEGLLRYFYSGQHQVESVHQATCTRSAAVKYMVAELAARCVAYVERYMEPDDVCPFLDYILTMCEDGVDGSAKAVLHNNGLFVLASKTFESCLHYTVNYILDNVHNAPEMSVLQAIHACGRRRCLERGKFGGEPADLRSVVRPFFLKLRFLVLTVTEFVRGPNVWGMLNAEESLDIVCNIIEEDSLPMPADFCTVRTQRV